MSYLKKVEKRLITAAKDLTDDFSNKLKKAVKDWIKFKPAKLKTLYNTSEELFKPKYPNKAMYRGMAINEEDFNKFLKVCH